jgi:hypothetical protein
MLLLPEHGVQVASPEWDIQSGTEFDQCYYVKLGNDEPLEVVRIETARRRGTHHYNVWKSLQEHEEGWHGCPSGLDLFNFARPTAWPSLFHATR